MLVAAEILRTYVNPRQAIRNKLGDGTGEGQALAYLLAACLMHFCSRLPQLSRESANNTEDLSFPALASGQFIGAVLVAPLAFYALAAASRLIGRAFGGRSNWRNSRIALFWSLLSAAPLGLVAGAASMLLPLEFAPIVMNVLSWVAAGAFALIWAIGILEAENPP
ncbi:MAG: YIP1 family protein [Albidovulum sp.]|nr:YIP1 family protein [Albidovulum sp.]